MKEVIQSIPSGFHQRKKRINVFRFLKFALVLIFFVFVYMNIYRHLMSVERSQEIGWVECFYWVSYYNVHIGVWRYHLLGDDGRLFSMVVMFTGVFYLFIVLPFVFMEFLYKPFVEYQTGARIPRKFEGSEQKHLY